MEGEHPLWKGVSDPYKDTIRAFLVYFHTQIQRHSTERFNFRNGSVGAALLLFVCLVGKGDEVLFSAAHFMCPLCTDVHRMQIPRHVKEGSNFVRNHSCTKTTQSALHLALIRQDLRPMLHPREQQAACSCKACHMRLSPAGT